MPLVMSVSDRVYCLEAGLVIAEGNPGAGARRPAGDRQLPGCRATQDGWRHHPERAAHEGVDAAEVGVGARRRGRSGVLHVVLPGGRARRRSPSWPESNCTSASASGYAMPVEPVHGALHAVIECHTFWSAASKLSKVICWPSVTVGHLALGRQVAGAVLEAADRDARRQRARGGLAGDRRTSSWPCRRGCRSRAGARG